MIGMKTIFRWGHSDADGIKPFRLSVLTSPTAILEMATP
jgi:hypothetical protein